MCDGLGGVGVEGTYLPVIKELNLYISFLLTESSGYGLDGLFENFFFKMQFMPSRQQRAVKSQIFILQVTSAIII